MTIDANLKFAGVEGESTHKDHKGEIDLLAWSWDVRQESTAAAGTGSGKGKGVPGQFVFAHYYDKASPVLAKACAAPVEAAQALSA